VTDGAARRRLRIRMDDDPGLAWDIEPDEVPTAGPASGGSGFGAVVELAVTAADRAAGIRRFEVTLDGWRFRATVEDADRARLRERAAGEQTARHHHGPHIVSAPMTGRVVRLWIAEGDTVEAGQRLLAIEAMKMENEVRSPRAGVVTSIAVAVDDSVEHGDELVEVR
jgi:biotin carboxyl carrier protein